MTGETAKWGDDYSRRWMYRYAHAAIRNDLYHFVVSVSLTSVATLSSLSQKESPYQRLFRGPAEKIMALSFYKHRQRAQKDFPGEALFS
jgi:hypothetical protein